MGKAPSERPAFQPYRGKPAVRNDRGDRGDVGIIRSPVRASVLPDRSTSAPSRALASARTATKRYSDVLGWASLRRGLRLNNRAPDVAKFNVQVSSRTTLEMVVYDQAVSSFVGGRREHACSSIRQHSFCYRPFR